MSLSRPQQAACLTGCCAHGHLSPVLPPSSGLPAGRVSAESVAGGGGAVSASNRAAGGLQHTCPQQAAGERGCLVGACQRSRGPLLLPFSLCCFMPRMQWCRSVLLTPPRHGGMHPCRALGHTPRDGRSHRLCLAASIPCQQSQPVQRAEQHTTPSAAQHALCLMLLLPPLLQATSPAIPSPYVPAELNTSSAIKAAIDSRSPTTPGASYAQSTLDVLTVSQSKAVAAIMLAMLCSRKSTCPEALSVLLGARGERLACRLASGLCPPLPLFLVARWTCAEACRSCASTTRSERSADACCLCACL